MTRFYERLAKFIDDYTPDAVGYSEEWVTQVFHGQHEGEVKKEHFDNFYEQF